jgi:hypothetical protein
MTPVILNYQIISLMIIYDEKNNNIYTMQLLLGNIST